MKLYTLRLETNRLVTCHGVSGADAARRYSLIHPDAVIEAWSEAVSAYQLSVYQYQLNCINVSD
jgi:hypothetical protein